MGRGVMLSLFIFVHFCPFIVLLDARTTVVFLKGFVSAPFSGALE
jgi:hypothetical protein